MSLFMLIACEGSTQIGTKDTSGGDDTSEAPTFNVVDYEGSPLLLNEVMPDRDANATAAAGSGDWVEILNPNSEAITLDGYGLDPGVPHDLADVWPFPTGTTIPAGGYLFVWGELPPVSDGGLVANFSLNVNDDRLVLYHMDAATNTLAIVDEVEWIAEVAIPNSWARTPDGGLQWELDATPTPGDAND